MSLLDSGTEDVVIFPEIVTTSPDGNIKTKPGTVGVPAKARIQVLGESGTSSRRQEQDGEGYESEKVYSLRFSRDSQSKLGRLGAQSYMIWEGHKWAIFGDENRYNSSRRTAHTTYTVKRF